MLGVLVDNGCDGWTGWEGIDLVTAGRVAWVVCEVWGIDIGAKVRWLGTEEDTGLGELRCDDG